RPDPGVRLRTRRRARRTGGGRGQGRPDRARRRPAQAQPGNGLPQPDRTGVPGMTSTTSSLTPPDGAGRTGQDETATGAGIAALIAEAPVPHPTLAKTFGAMMAREFRVLRRNSISTFMRAVLQPLLFVFVFIYVMPKIGGGFMFGGAAATAGAGAGAAGGDHFAADLASGPVALRRPIPGSMAGSVP